MFRRKQPTSWTIKWTTRFSRASGPKINWGTRIIKADRVNFSTNIKQINKISKYRWQQHLLPRKRKERIHSLNRPTLRTKLNLLIQLICLQRRRLRLWYRVNCKLKLFSVSMQLFKLSIYRLRELRTKKKLMISRLIQVPKMPTPNNKRPD